MRIDQRNAVATADNAYTVDRWQLGRVTTGAVQCAQSQDSPTGFGTSLLFDVTTADTSIAAGEYGVLTQYIEGLNTSDLSWGTAAAQTVTLSFWVKSTTTGTYCAAFRNSALNRSYVATYSVASANTWEYKTITVPGDTTGTWLSTNGAGIIVTFTFAVGSTYQTTAGAWQAGNFLGTSAQVNLLAATTNEIRISGVQLEKGSVATEFERRSYGQELAFCLRYFYRFGEGTVWSAGSTSGSGGNAFFRAFSFQWPVQMRATPSLTYASNGSATGGTIGYMAGSVGGGTVIVGDAAGGSGATALNSVNVGSKGLVRVGLGDYNVITWGGTTPPQGANYGCTTDFLNASAEL